MPRDPDLFDLFVSYARKDNVGGWISGFVEELLAEHRNFSGGRALVPFSRCRTSAVSTTGDCGCTTR